jgi:hypothetical protein
MKIWYLISGILFVPGVLNLAIASIKVSDSFTISVTNTADIALIDAPVTLKVKDILAMYPDFNITTCIVLSGNSEIPSQLNDTDNNGIKDKLVFLCNLNPFETKKITIKATEIPNDSRKYKKRTQAELSCKSGGKFVEKQDSSGGHEYVGGEFKNVNFLRVPFEHTDHSFFIRYEGPGWESDKIGFRFYLDWRNAIDIFGKLTDTMVLQRVGLDGFDSYHNLSAWGMDNFKVGKSLGLGSIAMWENNEVNMVSVTDSVTCTISINGPVESMIETNYYGWNVNNKKRNIVSKLIIYGGSRMTCHKIYFDGDPSTLCTGLNKDPVNSKLIIKKSDKGWSYMATWGKQSLNNDNLGIAVIVKTEDLVQFAEDDLSYVAVLNPEKNSLEYYLMAAWEKEQNGIKTETEFVKYLDYLITTLNNPLKIEL